jgi:hypothetical protein
MYGEPGALLVPPAEPTAAPAPVPTPNEAPPIVPEKPGVVYGDANVVTTVARLFGTV